MSDPKHTTKPVWKTPRSVGGHRMNDLFNRYRKIVIEMKGLTLTELAEKPQDDKLEQEILQDFCELKNKHLNQ